MVLGKENKFQGYLYKFYHRFSQSFVTCSQSTLEITVISFRKAGLFHFVFNRNLLCKENITQAYASLF